MSHLGEENEVVLPQWGFLRDVQVPKTLGDFCG